MVSSGVNTMPWGAPEKMGDGDVGCNYWTFNP